MDDNITTMMLVVENSTISTTDIVTNDTTTDVLDTADASCISQTPVYVTVLGTILFFIVWPFVVLDMKWFPLGRPAAALVGAALMVIFYVVDQLEVYEIEGAMGNLQALFLLIGMMLLSYYFDREGLLRQVALFIFGKSQDTPLRFILWKVCLLAAVLAAFITNDATSLVLSPLMFREFVKQKRPKREYLPLALGLATSANIGSASTVFGNPQNAFIASAGNVALSSFLITLLPGAILGICLSIGLLHLIFIREIFFNKGGDDEEAQKGDVEMRPYGQGTMAEERESIALSYDQSADPYHSSRIAAEREVMYSNENLSSIVKSRSRQSLKAGGGPVKPSGSGQHLQVPNSQSVPEIKVDGEGQSSENGLKRHAEARKAIEAQDKAADTAIAVPDKFDDEDEDIVQIKPLKERSWRELAFITWLITASVVMVILLAIPPPPTVPVRFNLGLVPLGTGIMTMLVDTILNRKYAFDAMQRIDWTVILMFMGLFTWLGGFQNTCIPEILVDSLAPYMNLNTVGGVLLFTVLVAVGSNIFSNVPLTILIVDRISELCGDTSCDGPLPGLLLAWVATIAGNFTLIGSITNLIVAEKARSVAGYNLTFIRYIRFGIVSTLVVMFGCLPIVYFLGTVA